MASVKLSLSDPMKQWVEAQAKSGHYADAGDFVRDLIDREKQRRDAIAAMQCRVDEALASGIGNRSSDALFAEAEARADRPD